MTYNFDADKWYDIEVRMLTRRFDAGELTRSELDDAMDRLDRRHSEMLERLDGTYQLPDTAGGKRDAKAR